MYFEQFRSGTEEEYDDLKSLLEDITTFVDDMPVVNVVKQKKTFSTSIQHSFNTFQQC